MPAPVEILTLVAQNVALTPFSLDQTASGAGTIAAAVAGHRYRLRAFTISSEGTEVTTARIRGTIQGVDTILGHLSTDDQVGMVMVLPGFIELDAGTAITSELTAGSTNGVLFMVYVEVVRG